MPTTDEDLVKQQEELTALRQQVLDARADVTAKENATNNDVVAGQIAAEREQLKRELAELKERGKAANLRAAAAAVLDPAGVAQAQEDAKQKALAEAAAADAAPTSKKGGNQ